MALRFGYRNCSKKSRWSRKPDLVPLNHLTKTVRDLLWLQELASGWGLRVHLCFQKWKLPD